MTIDLETARKIANVARKIANVVRRCDAADQKRKELFLELDAIREQLHAAEKESAAIGEDRDTAVIDGFIYVKYDGLWIRRDMQSISTVEQMTSEDRGGGC